MPNEDAEAYRATLRSFLGRHSPEAHVRRWMADDHGHDTEMWRRAATELGLQGLMIREDLGGSGAGLVEMGVAFEELGRALTCGPFLSTLGLAVPLLTFVERHSPVVDGSAGDGLAAGLLAAIGSGSAVVTVALDAALAETDAGTCGAAETVLDGADASTVIAPVRRTDGTVGLYAFETQAAGVKAEPLVSLDSTRRLARLTFDGVHGEQLLAGADAVLEHARAVACLLLSAEQLGGAAIVLENTVEYARTRIQFGRPIGSFQAVKHRLADLLVEVESTRSVVAHALHRVAADPDALFVEAALARSVASDAYLAVASAGIQIGGGIGFTWEHSAHLHLKRAKSASILFGTSTEHRRRLAQQLKIAVGT
jgi:alkylation response protein AidB-like acyl-CoA dehydrogenase